MRTVAHVIRAGIASSLLLACLANAAAKSQDVQCGRSGTLTFGFLPLVSSEKLVQRFAPLVHYLSAALNTPVRIETAADFDTFIRRTNNEKRYDLLFTAPHLFYLAREKADYQLLVSVDAPGMSAIIVVPQKSKINTIRDLTGRKLATVDPMGLATLLVRKQLEEHGLDPDADLTLVKTPSHNASLLSSYYGATDASSLMMPPFKVANPEVRESMRIIAVTESAPHMPISAAPWIEPECREATTLALLGMPSTVAGKEALVKAGFKRFARSLPEQYDSLKWAAEQIDVE